MTNRELAEAALSSLRDPEGPEPDWPPVARRIREARERLGVPETEIAARIDLDVSEYWDLEFHDDEAFTVCSINALARLAGVLGTTPHALLFGPDFPAPHSRTAFATIARALEARAASQGISIDDLGEEVGWELEGLLEEPETIGELNVDGLRDLCQAIEIDWATALPIA